MCLKCLSWRYTAFPHGSTATCVFPLPAFPTASNVQWGAGLRTTRPRGLKSSICATLPFSGMRLSFRRLPVTFSTAFTWWHTTAFHRPVTAFSRPFIELPVCHAGLHCLTLPCHCACPLPSLACHCVFCTAFCWHATALPLHTTAGFTAFQVPAVQPNKAAGVGAAAAGALQSTTALSPPFHRRSIALSSPFHRRSIALSSPFRRRSIALSSPFCRRSAAVPSPLHRRCTVVLPFSHPLSPFRRRSTAIPPLLCCRSTARITSCRWPGRNTRAARQRCKQHGQRPCVSTAFQLHFLDLRLPLHCLLGTSR